MKTVLKIFSDLIIIAFFATILMVALLDAETTAWLNHRIRLIAPRYLWHFYVIVALVSSMHVLEIIMRCSGLQTRTLRTIARWSTILQGPAFVVLLASAVWEILSW